MSELVINGRFRLQRMTGIQRVGEAITARLRTPHTVIEPEKSASGLSGHAWEQLVLPVRAKGKLIWGPCNTGPILAQSQILTIHGAAVLDHPEWFSPGFARLNRSLWPVLSKRARSIVTVSNFSKARICKLLSVPEKKVEVIWNGVDDRFHPSSEHAIESATASLGIAGRPYFATLSTLEPRKNLKLVLQAWSKARPFLPTDTVLLVIGGEGSRAVFGRSHPDERAAGESVVFSGYVAEEILPALLSGSLGVLYPSIYEGFGLPVLEAMACGVAAVTTHLTSLPEVGGDAALYVDAGDPQDLANTILNLAKSRDLRDERSAMGLQRARLFTWDNAAERMDAIFAQHM